MTSLIHFGVRVLDLIFAAGLIGTVVVLIMTGFEDMMTIFGKSPDEPRTRYARAAHQSTSTPAAIR